MTKTLTTGTWTYSYDTVTNGKGRMVSVSKGTEGYFYDGYDVMGRLTQSRQVTNAGGADQTYTLTYGYDLAGNMTREEYPSGRVITTVFDPAARLSEVKGQKAGEANKTYASQYQYTPHGGVSQMMMSNGVMRETMLYNSRLQPTLIELRKTSDNSLLLGLDYTYGTTTNNGNVQTQTIRFGATTFNQSYSYDSLNRLATATETGSWSQSYGYDRWGNRWVSSSSGYAINADLTPTQASHVSTATNRVALSGFSYDTSGNQKTQTRGGQSETLNYDSENRMTSFVSGSSTTNYVYDGDGRRVKKVSGSETVVFVYNAGGQLIAEYTTGQPQSGGTSYLTSDHLGSTRLVTDSSGQVKARHDYLPFGEETGAGVGQRTAGMGYGAADSTRQRFTSKERDQESGLDYFLARYYSSAQGRFTSTDPIYFQVSMAIDPQRFNLYGYARNNPFKWVDPSGERLFLRGNTNWLQTNVLYEMAGGQAEFDRYFEIGNGEVVLRSGADTSTLSSGLQLILDLVNATENYLYFAGTDGGAAADLFSSMTIKGKEKALRDQKGRLTKEGKALAESFAGSERQTGGVGALVATAGRTGQPSIANLPNGDPVFAVIAYNTNREVTQSGLGLGQYDSMGNKDEYQLVVSAQIMGLGHIVKPVSFFIHESAENLEFARRGDRNYQVAHSRAIAREATIRRDLGITGGFSGGFLTSRIR